MTTTEKNILIADFLGLAKQDQSNGGGFYLYESPENGEYVEPNELKFDSSWDWLMPVVVNVSKTKMGNIDIRPSCVIAGYGGYSRTYSGSFDNLINDVYDSVIEFIQWYNKNKH